MKMSKNAKIIIACGIVAGIGLYSSTFLGLLIFIPTISYMVYMYIFNGEEKIFIN